MNAVVVTPNHPTRVDHGGPHHLIIVNTPTVRIRVGYAGRRIVDRALNPFDKPATRPASFTQFVRFSSLRTDTGTLSAARNWLLAFRFKFVWPFKAARRLIRLHGARALFQSSARRVADVFHVLSYLPSCVSKHSQGTIASCAKNLSRRRKQ